MKTLVFILLAASGLACEIPDKLNDQFVNCMATAIYKAEGGKKARAPYGILSIKTNSEAEARQITINSIRNNWRRWEKAGKPASFVDFMANRWCPESADPVGNRNWKKNVKRFLSHK